MYIYVEDTRQVLA